MVTDMNGPPHETHERLNRDLSRLRMRDVGFWGGWSALIAILMLLLILFTNAPRETRFVTGIAGQTMTLQNETRLSVLMRVTVEGRQSDVVFPGQLNIPKKSGRNMLSRR